MRKMIEEFVNESIDELDIRDDVKAMLKTHERKPVLIDRLTHQMKLTEEQTHKVTLTKDKIRTVVKDFTGFFFSLAKTDADAHQKRYNVNLMNQFNQKIQKDNPGEWNVKTETL